MVILFHIWGLTLAIGFLIGIWLAGKRAAVLGYKKEQVWNLGIWILIGAMIGARILWILQFPSELLSDPLKIFKIWQGGMIFYGGFIGGVLSGWFYLRRKHLPIIKFTDIIISSLALNIAIGRIGCLIIHDHAGKITGLALYPEHLVALYLSLNVLILFILLRGLQNKLQNVPGALSLIALFYYSITRFLLDFTRLPGSNPEIWKFTFSQWLSVFLFIISIFLIINRKNNYARTKK